MGVVGAARRCALRFPQCWLRFGAGQTESVAVALRDWPIDILLRSRRWFSFPYDATGDLEGSPDNSGSSVWTEAGAAVATKQAWLRCRDQPNGISAAG